MLENSFLFLDAHKPRATTQAKSTKRVVAVAYGSAKRLMLTLFYQAR